MRSIDGPSESSRTSPFRGIRLVPLFAIGVAGLLTGCANQAQVRTVKSGIDPRYGVSASPRVIADGQPVPKGGGTSLVGKPYTIAGRVYYPSERPYSAVGLASWYGSDFHGRRTANGEIFDRMSISAAHPTMPLPSYARVTNLRNNRSMIVRVNDRGPYHADRVMDVSEQVAEALDFRRVGTSRVRVDFVGRASLAGSDDRKLLATLRTDGGAAGLGRGGAGLTEVAEVEEQTAPEPRARVASVRSAPIERREERMAERREERMAERREERVAERREERVAERREERAIERVPMSKPVMPPPPLRPLDLRTIPGAGVPVAAARLTGHTPGPRTPPRTIQAALRDDVPLPVRR